MEVQEEVYPSAERADGGGACNSDSHLFAEMQWQTAHHCDPWRTGWGPCDANKLIQCTYTTHQFSAQVNTDACVCVHEATQ